VRPPTLIKGTRSPAHSSPARGVASADELTAAGAEAVRRWEEGGGRRGAPHLCGSRFSRGGCEDTRTQRRRWLWKRHLVQQPPTVEKLHTTPLWPSCTPPAPPATISVTQRRSSSASAGEHAAGVGRGSRCRSTAPTLRVCHQHEEGNCDPSTTLPPQRARAAYRACAARHTCTSSVVCVSLQQRGVFSEEWAWL
jgi:hypothetical protein